VGGGTAAFAALHDLCQSGGNSLWHWRPARGPAALAAAAEAMFAEDFAARVLPFEARAAARYPEIVLARRLAGNPIEKFDALIAATALAAGASIATRDSGGFAGCGLTVIDPWTV
jgi:predicted nucleic acid-binding protein